MRGCAETSHSPEGWSATRARRVSVEPTSHQRTEPWPTTLKAPATTLDWWASGIWTVTTLGPPRQNHGFDEFKGWLVQNGKSQGYFSTEWYNGKEVVAVHENDDGRQGRYETELSPHCARQLSGIPDLRRIIFFRGWSKSPTGFKPLETRVPLTSPLPDRHLKPTSIVLGEEKHNVPQN